MALSGELGRFTYSGAATNSVVQGDPLLSLGLSSPDQFPASQIPLSAPYAQASLNGISPAINKLSASTPDSGESRVPAVDDWVTVVTGAAAPAFARITSIDTGVLTLDRELPALTAAADFIRTSKIENVFPNVTTAQASAGRIDHRAIYFWQNGGGTEGNFRFWIVPLTPNAATIEILASGGDELNNNIPSIATGTDDPFTKFDHIDFSLGSSALTWDKSEPIGTRYSQSMSSPMSGSNALVIGGSVPIWIRRTIPVSATGGKCVFAILVASNDDITPNPDPFITSFIFEFEIAELTYSSTTTIDRIVFTGGAARVTTTISDQFGQPVIGLNAWIEIESGPGSINTDLDGRTNSSGQIQSIYTAPSTITVDPVLRLVVPTNPEI